MSDKAQARVLNLKRMSTRSVQLPQGHAEMEEDDAVPEAFQPNHP